MSLFTTEDARTLDLIIHKRRTTRNFTDQIPDKTMIEEVITAGIKSPYAAISAEDVQVFRKFYVIRQGNPILEVIDELIKEQSQIDLDAFKEEQKNNKIFSEYGEVLEKIWGHVAEKGIPQFQNLPCLILIAEWRGARRAERQSIAHALQNMWLKATSLNLGFQLVSPIESMTDNKVFCKLFDLPVGEYGFNACIIGYPKNEEVKSKVISSETIWM